MFKQGINLSEHTSYRIGGPARYFCTAKNVEEIEKAVLRASNEKLPIFVLGGGTNIVFSDDGYDGVILKPSLSRLEDKNGLVFVEGSVLMTDLLDFAATKGLSGLEWAGGLPGTLGGAIRGNAGAFGGEIKDSIVEVVSLRIQDGKTYLMRRTATQCNFGYRNSVFKTSPYQEIILFATLKMGKGSKKEIRNSIEEKIAYRFSRHPMEYPNAGSMFKNVPVHQFSEDVFSELASHVKTDPFPVIPAAYLISQTDLRGVGIGGAMISPKHPNFIVNVLHATAADISSLANLVEATIHDKFGVDLEREVMYV
ncbi:MAG: UDP-N-acetylenolpyruvoylglucosamine reductase [Candidatus Harrisonbacteria bacterium CG10_big_fil_rev_8_21_14_0_10_40_38]|uniref:UDP-N-acetylenolpyruvoylglucosamine reductase n=1 Tax=Candidatus Harrisonbacteria bacterium CG10_big_fil_rev_8_21_14_0_10_40_38 TaxID=1974583 RepID=A0A2H0UR59_9BACT|nr:MAG: UDP-N-acetylenolpyruvoylglucosamine reductase [Candidatus Harrisonbacteria bacterium CG10_big_fil_rev_8_21_14_0_10_40_38]